MEINKNILDSVTSEVQDTQCHGQGGAYMLFGPHHILTHPDSLFSPVKWKS